MIIRQFWLVFFLLVGTAVPTFAQCDFLEESASFTCKKITREEALNKLAKEVGFTFSFPSNSFENEIISVNYKSKKISQILRVITNNASISYACVGNRSIAFFNNKYEPFSLAGFVRDTKTKMPVNGALVVIEQGWVETDNDGFFLVQVNRLPCIVSVYHPGYDAFQKVVDESMKGDDIAQWYIEPNANLTEAVVNVFDSMLFVNKTGGVNINMKEIEKIPSISGSPGILNSLRFIPGLQSTLEVNGGLIVRGGSKDQNLILYDGMELYNPMHLFGLFSVFGEGSIQSIAFYKNSFPAQFGGRLSSVLDVNSKQGDYKKWNAKLDFNPVLFEATINGPLKKDKTSFLISGRRSFTDFFPLFYEQIQNQNQLSRFKYFFYDVSSTLNHRFSDKSSLYFTNYFGGDKGYIRGKNVINSNTPTIEENKDVFLQSNILSSLGWKMWLTKSFQVHARVGYTSYRFGHENSYDLSIVSDDQSYQRNTKLTYKSSISDWKTGIYFKNLENPNSIFNYGFENVWHNFAPANSSYFLQENDLIPYDTFFAQRNSEITEQRFFAQNFTTLGVFRLTSGLHFTNFENGISFHALQPRFNVSYEPGSKNKVELGFAKTAQFILSVPNNVLGIPIDIWVPADSNIKPLYCWIFSGGFAHQFSKNLVFRTDVYYKHFNNVTEFKSGVVDFVSEWDKALLTGISRSKGAEFMIKKDKGYLNGWMSYSISKTDRSFSELNNGEWFPFQFDRRHDFNIVLNYQPNDFITIGCTWTYASGHYLTVPESQFVIGAEGKKYLIQQYGNKNNLKLPAYHRLDLGLHYKKSIGQAQQIWSFSLYNAYNRSNVYYVNSAVNKTGNVAFQPISLLPILPSINYSIRF